MAMVSATGLTIALGLVLGSFLNVVAHRLPRRESIVTPRSRCPSCETPVASYDNIPVLSWLLLRGRCRHCQSSISARYPLIEAGTAALLVLVLVVLGAGEHLWLALPFVALLVAVAAIDLEHRIIPNRLLAPAAAYALVAGLAVDPGGVPEQLIAGLGAGGFLLAAALAYPGGMGMGDVKLAGVMGLFLGRAVAPALLVGMVAGALVGAVIIARKGAREGRKTAVPFGPFLALGGVVALLAGDDIVGWYADNFL